jgi:glycosyltransferase involved in cell wall biosynthesis
MAIVVAHHTQLDGATFVEADHAPEVSVIVPARNEEVGLADCLRSLVGQAGADCEIIVVDDHSTDGTRAIAESFPVRVIMADPLPPDWTGKCNAVWSGAKIAKGKWLLFTDADTRHATDSIARGLQEAKACDAALLSYSPKQEVHSFAERALMPVIFAVAGGCGQWPVLAGSARCLRRCWRTCRGGGSYSGGPGTSQAGKTDWT